MLFGRKVWNYFVPYLYYIWLFPFYNLAIFIASARGTRSSTILCTGSVKIYLKLFIIKQKSMKQGNM